MRKHKGERPYQCDKCDYKASNQTNLTTHMRKHTGERPYKCDYCDYRTSYQCDVTKHTRRHTVENRIREINVTIEHPA